LKKKNQAASARKRTKILFRRDREINATKSVRANGRRNKENTEGPVKSQRERQKKSKRRRGEKKNAQKKTFDGVET